MPLILTETPTTLSASRLMTYGVSSARGDTPYARGLVRDSTVPSGTASCP
jgi:hypothetical protein